MSLYGIDRPTRPDRIESLVQVQTYLNDLEEYVKKCLKDLDDLEDEKEKVIAEVNTTSHYVNCRRCDKVLPASISHVPDYCSKDCENGQLDSRAVGDIDIVRSNESPLVYNDTLSRWERL